MRIYFLLLRIYGIHQTLINIMRAIKSQLGLNVGAAMQNQRKSENLVRLIEKSKTSPLRVNPLGSRLKRVQKFGQDPSVSQLAAEKKAYNLCVSKSPTSDNFQRERSPHRYLTRSRIKMDYFASAKLLSGKTSSFLKEKKETQQKINQKKIGKKALNIQNSEYYMDEKMVQQMRQKVERLQQERSTFHKRWVSNLEKVKKLQNQTKLNQKAGFLQIELYKQILKNLTNPCRMSKSMLSTTTTDEKISSLKKAIATTDEQDEESSFKGNSIGQNCSLVSSCQL